MKKELEAWRARFPQYEYRRADECIALKLEVLHGCHCDLDPDMEPDGCVIDDGTPNDCVFATGLVAAGKGKESCSEWRPIEFNSKTGWTKK